MAIVEDYGPLLPISFYGTAKLASVGFISTFCHMFDMRAWIFRFADVIKGRSGMIMLEWKILDGNQS